MYIPCDHLLYIGIHNEPLTATAAKFRVAAGADCHVTGMEDGGGKGGGGKRILSHSIAVAANLLLCMAGHMLSVMR